MKIRVRVNSPYEPPVDKVADIPEGTDIVNIELQIWNEKDETNTKLKVEFIK